jgi:3-hydroxybutyryl-CoA dehydrogenase
VDASAVRKVAIIGAGTMGPGLAQVFATSGREVWLCDREQAILDKALAVVASSLETFTRHGLVAQDGVPAVLDRVRPTESLPEAAAGADLVIECITEDLDAKAALFTQLDEICLAGAIMTSNTSYLDIFQVMPERRLPSTVIAHWFAPPQVVPLVEVVKGEATSPETVELVVELLKQVDHVPVVLEKFVPGFCVNRFLRSIGREVFFLLDNGYMTAEQLDLAVKASIIPRALVLGFVQRYDFTGLDLSLSNLQNADFVEPPIDNQPSSLVEHVENGELGVKSGKGFYDYGDRDLREVLRARDDALIEVFDQSRDLIRRRV